MQFLRRRKGADVTKVKKTFSGRLKGKINEGRESDDLPTPESPARRT